MQRWAGSLFNCITPLLHDYLMHDYLWHIHTWLPARPIWVSWILMYMITDGPIKPNINNIAWSSEKFWNFYKFLMGWCLSIKSLFSTASLFLHFPGICVGVFLFLRVSLPHSLLDLTIKEIVLGMSNSWDYNLITSNMKVCKEKKVVSKLRTLSKHFQITWQLYTEKIVYIIPPNL